MNNNKGSKLPYRIIILALCAFLLATTWYWTQRTPDKVAGIEPVEKAYYPRFTQQPAYSAAIEKAMPSLVFIYVEKNGPSGAKSSLEGGSGVIFSSDGLILTNRHVIENADKVWVTLYDMSTREATAVYPDPLLDLAVVKIDADGLTAAVIGDSDKLRVGDYVIALGNPLGLSPADGVGAATAGIVSKHDCSFVMQGVPYYDMIQTDAAISTGSSGGPLVNMDGEVVGINSAHALFAQNVGFAISMNTAKYIFDDVVKHGIPDHPYLGIIAEDMQPQLIVATTGSQRRAVITQVESGAPAAVVGLKVKDIILCINDREVNSVAQLAKSIWRMDDGDVIKITVSRNGETLSLSTTLVIRPDDKPLTEL